MIFSELNLRSLTFKFYFITFLYINSITFNRLVSITLKAPFI